MILPIINLTCYCVLQINRWVDPLAEHLIHNAKGSDIAKDGSSWVLRLLEQDTFVFADGYGAAQAVSIIHLFILSTQLISS